MTSTPVLTKLPLAHLEHSDFKYTDNKDELFERFNGDTSHANMEILQDNGEYRHFRVWGSGFFWAELVTAPNFLAIHGDMGSYILAREEKMVDFFDKSHIKSKYWAEKCVSHPVDSREITVLSEDKVLQWVKDYLSEHDVARHAQAEIINTVKSASGRTIDSYLYSLNELLEIIDPMNTDYSAQVQNLIDSMAMSEVSEFTQKSIHFEHSLATILAMVRTYRQSSNKG